MQANAPVRVVGVGASAGGLEALTLLFGDIPPDIGAAFIIVQHLSPSHRSLMPELLGRRTELQVRPAVHGEQIEAGVCYLMPAGSEVQLDGEMLKVAPVDGVSRHHRPIDTLFSSLAETRGSTAIGIVLSGTGSDGTGGAARIRDAGGLILVQHPASAQFDGMPRSTIDRGHASYVCTPQEMRGVLHDLLGKDPATESADELAPWVRDIVSSVSESTGLNLDEYKTSTLMRRLHRRMEDAGHADPRSYLRLLQEDSEEPSRLLASLLIDVTSFFRDAYAFEQLKQAVVPQIVNGPSDREIRVWCAGCAGGHEAYSIAILFLEALADSPTPRSLKIFATDANPLALEKAGAGVYTAKELASLSEDRLARFFIPFGQHYKVKESLRRHIVFAHHNLQADPPFTQVDLITCRNVMIYFQPGLQRRLLSLFHFALRAGGTLFLGSSETVGSMNDRFKSIENPKSRLYQRIGDRSLPISIPEPRARPRRPLAEPTRLDDRRLAESELRRAYSPPSALVDSDGNVVHLFGDLAAYLTLGEGSLSTRAEQLARGPLAAVVATLLAQSKRQRTTITYAGIALPEVDGAVRVTARPVSHSNHTLVSFSTESRPLPAQAEPTEQADLSGLHQELLYTRESLQSMIEELQSANEELQAANEEMLASNEELQATNEELHATNEELHTVSVERQQRIDELLSLHEDVENLQRTLVEATIFLNRDLTIRKFIGATERFLPILARDVGRPFEHFAYVFDGIDLAARAAQVLDSGEATFVEDAALFDDRHVSIRILPYRTERPEGRGVMVSMVDVTQRRQTERELNSVLDSLPQSVAVLDRQGLITRTNSSWKAFSAQHGGDDHIGADYLDITGQDPDAEAIVRGLRTLLHGEASAFEHEYPCNTPEEDLHFLMQARALAHDDGIVVSHIDITARLRAEEATRKAAHAFRLLFELQSTPMLIIDARSLRIHDANAAASELFERPSHSLVDAPLRMVAPERGIATWTAALADLEEEPVRVDAIDILVGNGAGAATQATFRPLGARGDSLVMVELHETPK